MTFLLKRKAIFSLKITLSIKSNFDKLFLIENKKKFDYQTYHLQQKKNHLVINYIKIIFIVLLITNIPFQLNLSL